MHPRGVLRPAGAKKGKKNPAPFSLIRFPRLGASGRRAAAPFEQQHAPTKVGG